MTIKIEDPEALRRAARMARDEGDSMHARELEARAVTAERRIREREAGVRNIGWNLSTL
jgi:hypothetical protein